MPSQVFYNKTKRKYVYNIMPIENVPSVLKHGLLCFHRASKLYHESVAMNEVQYRREQVQIPNGLNLHDYANLYFNPRNPMLYKRKGEAEKLCILAFSIDVMNIDGCVVTDRNAASNLPKFVSPQDGFDLLNFDKIYAEYWSGHFNQYENTEHKKIECAEVLVPYSVSPDYILGAFVVNDKAKLALEVLGFTGRIAVNSYMFFDGKEKNA